MKKIILLLTILYSFVSCASHDIPMEIGWSEKEEKSIFSLYENILEWIKYTSYEETYREIEWIWDDYIIFSSEGYTCWNIEDYLHYTMWIEVDEQLCWEWYYRNHDIIYFVYYEKHYEGLPSLWYKIFFFHPDKWYIDYVLPDDFEGIKEYSDIYINIISQARKERAEFPNIQWRKLYDTVSSLLEKDFENSIEGGWIREEYRKLQNYIK